MNKNFWNAPQSALEKKEFSASFFQLIISRAVKN